MKNSLFWFITFAIIGTVVGITVIFTQDFDQYSGHEKNENKVWVVLGVAVCTTLNPWGNDVYTRSMKQTDQILQYYETQNIEIYDMKIYIEQGTSRLEDACWLGDRLELLVGESDAKYLLDSGFIIAVGNATKQQIIDNHNQPKSLD